MIIAATKTDKPKTYWNYSVNAVRNERNEPIDRSLVMSGGSSLEDMISRIVADVAYYVGCGYKVEVRDITESCATCYGEGTISPKKGRIYSDKKVKCPKCQGVGTFTKLETIRQPEFSNGLNIKVG